MSHLTDELNWQPTFADATVRRAARSHLIERKNGRLALTTAGRDVAADVLSR